MPNTISLLLLCLGGFIVTIVLGILARNKKIPSPSIWTGQKIILFLIGAPVAFLFLTTIALLLVLIIN